MTSASALLDTNILIDLIDAGRPRSKEVRSLLRRLIGLGWQLWVPVSSLKDMYYVLRRSLARQGRADAEEVARESVRLVGATFSRADYLVADADVAMACDEPDFEDGVVRAVAERLGVDLIVSNDATAFAHAQVRPVTTARLAGEVS